MKSRITLLSEITLIVFFMLSNFGFLVAQPTDKQVKKEIKSASKSSNKTTSGLTEDKADIENEYPTKARHNIETYRKSDASLIFVDSTGKPLKNIKLEINQVSQDFLFGNLAFEIAGFAPKEPYKVDEFKARYKALFNYAIFPFYWNGYEKSAGNPEWEKNQAALDWCLANGITCKGHPLGWTGPAGTPKWLLNLPEETATDLYKARIFNNVIGYMGKINIWDVVNEPVNTVPWDVALKDKENSDELRYNAKKFGIEQIAPWVEQSYKWAYEANPDGTYILNEFFTLAIPEVRDRFYELLKELKKRNTPIGAIGIQAHEPREMWFSPVEMYKTFDLYSQFNLPIHITEFIPQSGGKDITGWRTGKWTEETQAEFAEQFYTLAFGHPSVASITWWGISDKSIWLEGGGLLDKEYNPKPVYSRLMKLIKEDWMTKNIQIETDKNGHAAFRGFFGNYNIVVTKPDGNKQTLNVHLTEKGTNFWKLVL
ncbi:MAG TPA: endo-1,4-beta-xylanase [Draconibacterium sp.]|nr:endo-1,4-beta-xylanase [Draconibacterium sp.]